MSDRQPFWLVLLQSCVVGATAGLLAFTTRVSAERRMCADVSEHLDAECKVMDHACWCSDGTGAWVRIGDDK